MHVLKGTKYIGYISKWLLFPSYCLKEESIFLWCLFWELGATPRGKIQESTEAILRPATSGIFKSQACLYWAPRGSSIIAEFFYPSTDSSGRLLVLGFCSSKLWFSVSACFLQFWRQCPVTSIFWWMYYKKSCWFLVCSSFLLFDCNHRTDNFQASYIPHWKSEISIFHTFQYPQNLLLPICLHFFFS